jgi:hypothetical protein
MKALRQARNASPSSERRTPGTAAIKPDLFKIGCGSTSLAVFVPIVHESCVKLNGIGERFRALKRRLRTGFLEEIGTAGWITRGTYFLAAACHPINHIQELP